MRCVWSCLWLIRETGNISKNTKQEMRGDNNCNKQNLVCGRTQQHVTTTTCDNNMTCDITTVLLLCHSLFFIRLVYQILNLITEANILSKFEIINCFVRCTFIVYFSFAWSLCLSHSQINLRGVQISINCVPKIVGYTQFNETLNSVTATQIILQNRRVANHDIATLLEKRKDHKSLFGL